MYVFLGKSSTGARSVAARSRAVRLALPRVAVLAAAGAIAALMLLVAGPAMSGSTTTTPSRLSAKLVPAKGALFGIWAKARSGRTIAGERSYLESQLGRKFDLDKRYYMWDSAWPTSYDRTTVAEGRTVAVSWVATRRDGSGIPWRQIANGSHDAHIAARADAVKQFGTPIMIAFHHEPEDDLRQLGTPAEFASAFRHIVTMFRNRGATNAVWVWNMMAYSFVSSSRIPLLEYYPGDSYVDWLAADGYNWFGSSWIGAGQPWRSFASVFQAFYDWGSARGKPLAIYEFGVLEDTVTPNPQRKAQWFRDALATIKRWPALKAIIYFNAHEWYYDSSQASTNAVKEIGADPFFNPLTAPMDTTAPSVAITSPAGAETLGGTVDVAASATDDVAVGKVEFLVNGSVAAADTTAPYGFALDTRTLANGTATLSARATDAAGNTGSSVPVAVTVANDVAPPSVAITSPAAGQSVSGAVEVTADASDDSAVAKVEFLVNGAVRASDSSAPYGFALDTAELANGSATLEARAVDTAGKVGTAAPVTVDVANGPPPPAADTVRPDVQLLQPTGGSTVSRRQVVHLAASASDDIGVASVEFKVNGVVRCVDTAAPYECDWMVWTTSGYVNYVRATAVDASGNSRSMYVTVTTR